jgi:predicted ATP-grasp superfamily ATP-dependent carboligase
MSSPSTVLVYEFFTGGGAPAGELPHGLAEEALGMLWAVLTDFRNWKAVRTITALDPRFEERVPGLNRATLPADEVVCVPQNGYQEHYPLLLKRCDAVLIIAPETSNILSSLTKQAERVGLPILGSSSSAVTIAGNKESCYRLFRKAQLRIPETRTVRFASVPRAAKQLGFPLVMKPVDGIACEGVCLIEHPSDLTLALEMVRETTSCERLMLQSFAHGVHASVSLLNTADLCLPLTLNLQFIEPGMPFRYFGTRVPFEHPKGILGVELARSAVAAIPGLKGYVGVDLVLSEDSAYVIEVNPRLTTSYIGLRQVCAVNLAQSIWNACVRGVLPDGIPVFGQTVIRKDDPSSWGCRFEDEGRNECCICSASSDGTSGRRM